MASRLPSGPIYKSYKINDTFEYLIERCLKKRHLNIWHIYKTSNTPKLRIYWSCRPCFFDLLFIKMSKYVTGCGDQVSPVIEFSNLQPWPGPWLFHLGHGCFLVTQVFPLVTKIFPLITQVFPSVTKVFPSVIKVFQSVFSPQGHPFGKQGHPSGHQGLPFSKYGGITKQKVWRTDVIYGRT